jgi:pantoate--beta-alanine ligase
MTAVQSSPTGGRVALVPTMGALHEGHAALLRAARARVGPEGAVVASVFVNPLQFGPGEDLDRYPRTMAQDLELCRREGVDVVFAPAVEEVYPGGPAAAQVTLDPGPLGGVLEGAARPTHFRGVLTVVAKLFGLVAPDVALFGEKDYQQLVLVRRMAADLCLPVDVVGVPTVREADGVALSSRNRYLSAAERQVAPALWAALRAGAEAGAAGPQAVRRVTAEVLAAGGPLLTPEYVELAAPDLGPVPTAGPARLLVAARVGTTRLLDNVGLTVGSLPR